MKQNINEEIIADLAVKSLLYEVSISPKLGLVSRFSNGSHKDMNFYTFIDSTISLREYFKNCFRYGKEKSLILNLENKKFFENLRILGKKAEENMFFATAGVNTHKGTIFSLGIFIAVFSLEFNRLKQKNLEIKFDKLFLKNLVEAIKNITFSLGEELQKTKNITAGEKIFRKYGIKGARGLALSGYELVLVDGIEKLKEYSEILDFETACILLLTYYVSVLDDTNIISRADKETLDAVKEKSKVIFDKNAPNLPQKRVSRQDCEQSIRVCRTNINKIKLREDVEKLNKFFIEKNISAGGSADLLILSIFVYFLTKKFEE